MTENIINGICFLFGLIAIPFYNFLKHEWAIKKKARAKKWFPKAY